MSKYSKEFIIKTCEEYLSCNSSKLELCNKYGIHYKNGKSIIDDWIPRYLEDGADAFLSTVGNKVYLSSDKISAVEDYIEGKGILYSFNDLQRQRKRYLCKANTISMAVLVGNHQTKDTESRRPLPYHPGLVYLGLCPFSLGHLNPLLNSFFFDFQSFSIDHCLKIL